MSLLGLEENRSKANFAVNGSAKEGMQMQNELARRGQVGEVMLRPRLLGTCLQANRKHGTLLRAQRAASLRPKKLRTGLASCLVINCQADGGRCVGRAVLRASWKLEGVGQAPDEG